ncbi:5-carboxymethyl-2-hydroxymuconate Delta-isomerase [Streptomyces sp. NBC_00091]|uniref:5-carboxymethyl-2-hydroxymuconate Delta-isomerase n=1 Tax=Streptomyces sp. NBC_00091 TaxID=2975648 RepID=UPI00225BE524|nr:isomerase [Streptomyces sp. NBC_00091]MCX5380754.1 isomerase [Streptomyces sp. NBC_00091]
MPQITVDFSASLSDRFDRRGFALALHALTAEAVDVSVETCKTRFRRVEETFVADGAPEHAVVHVDLALLPGRTEEVRARLSRAVLDLVREYTDAGPDAVVHWSVDVTELTEAYTKYVGAQASTVGPAGPVGPVSTGR